MIGTLIHVAELGYRCGLQRRQPTPDEWKAVRSLDLGEVFREARRRGRKHRAILQQQTLDLEGRCERQA